MLNVKWTFLSGLFVFELGSLICGVAPSSKVLIVGRAIAGTGAAGIITGAYVIVARSIPLQKRPLYAGIVGMMCVSSSPWPFHWSKCIFNGRALLF